jgi:hypothetical protein
MRYVLVLVAAVVLVSGCCGMKKDCAMKKHCEAGCTKPCCVAQK